MKAKTISQYCIIKWLDNNFAMDSLKVDFCGSNVAEITDRNGEMALVVYADGCVYMEEC